MNIDDAVVISLPERSERLRRFSQALPTNWPFPRIRIQNGVREEPPKFWQSSAGAWGCRQAHLNVLADAWRRGVQTTLVMEDDAVFVPNFAAAWNLFSTGVPAHWSMIMLGGQHISPPVRIGDNVVRCQNTRRTHAYLVKLKAIPLLMRTWSQARRHIDHSLIDVQAATTVYAPSVFLVGQAEGWSDISGKDNPDIRFWQPEDEANTRTGTPERPPGLLAPTD